MESKTELAGDSITNVCRSGNISETVIDAVAEAKGVDPLELTPLYDVIDPDALNRMFTPTVGSPPPTTELRFSMDGCRVIVRGDGEVVVTPQAENEAEPVVPTPNQD